MVKPRTSVVVLFNLKSDMTAEEYEEWARTTDLPCVRQLNSVDKFEVLKTRGLLGQKEISPYQYIEIINIADMDEFGEEINTPVLQQIAIQFQSFADDPKFIVCHDIEETIQGPLSSKVAVVTGAGHLRGLGAAISRRLAKDGASVVVSDLDPMKAANLKQAAVSPNIELSELVDQICDANGIASSFTADVTDWQQVVALADYAVDTYGRLDIWINNAGIGYIMQPIMELSPADWQSVIDVNLTGCFYGTKAAAKHMISQGEGGRIVNIASQAAKSGFPFAQAYCASKHGLVGLARSAAIELGEHQITVNNVCPNHVTTDLGEWQNDYFSDKLGLSLEQYLANMEQRIPLGRTGKADDTANAVAYLCSDAAAYITAESMNVSGGEEPH